MAILVVAEHDHRSLKAATLSTVTAAKKLGDTIHLLVLGHQCQEAAKEASAVEGITKVLVADDAGYAHALAENIAPAIAALASGYSHILAPSSTFGKNILPRAAALLDMAHITDVIDILSADRFKRPIYAGNVIATVQSSDKIKLMTIRTTAFAKASGNNQAPVESISALPASSLSSFTGLKSSDSSGPDLTTARVVISGGRGLGNAENFKLLTSLAQKIGNCAIGASRAAVDAGYVPSDYQVGQTGKVVAPELYIAVGISGAIQHLAGMKDSKIIVAINKDENAPIFDIADYGLVGDLFTILPQFEQLL